jgi:hypothetical protein
LFTQELKGHVKADVTSRLKGYDSIVSDNWLGLGWLWCCWLRVTLGLKE